MPEFAPFDISLSPFESSLMGGMVLSVYGSAFNLGH